MKRNEIKIRIHRLHPCRSLYLQIIIQKWGKEARKNIDQKKEASKERIKNRENEKRGTEIHINKDEKRSMYG